MGSLPANTIPARRIVEEAIAARVFPAASIEVGSATDVLWQDALGTLTFDADAPATTIETPFDLASLTKVIATTTVLMDLVGSSQLGLDEPVSSLLPEWIGADRAAATVADLLEHASGLPARLAEAPPSGREAFARAISTLPLDYEPRAKSVYSDLDFVLLGFLAADRGDATLDELFSQLVRLKPGKLAFNPGDEMKRVTAPTLPLDEDPRRGRVLQGEVHDNYAAALGGVAGHAGLFGSAPAVGAFARQMLRAARGDRAVPPPFSADLVARFTTKGTVPGSSRALGWDTMLPTSSCGTRMSAAAFGQVGFTGTSLWIDPQRDRYFVLLTNRACGGGSLDAMRTVRRAFHDQISA